MLRPGRRTARGWKGFNRPSTISHDDLANAAAGVLTLAQRPVQHLRMFTIADGCAGQNFQQVEIDVATGRPMQQAAPPVDQLRRAGPRFEITLRMKKGDCHEAIDRSRNSSAHRTDHLRWPERGTAIAWTRAHECVDALQDFVRDVDLGCLKAEQDRELSAGAIARRRAEICDQVMIKLATFRLFTSRRKHYLKTLLRWRGCAIAMPTKYNCSRNLSKHFAIYKKALRPRDGWGGSGARCARGFLFDGMAKVLERRAGGVGFHRTAAAARTAALPGEPDRALAFPYMLITIAFIHACVFIKTGDKPDLIQRSQ